MKWKKIKFVSDNICEKLVADKKFLNEVELQQNIGRIY